MMETKGERKNIVAMSIDELREELDAARRTIDSFIFARSEAGEQRIEESGLLDRSRELRRNKDNSSETEGGSINIRDHDGVSRIIARGSWTIWIKGAEPRNIEFAPTTSNHC